jgi:prophage tail gpP-like protein
MPNATEIAEVRVNGQKFRDWKTVAVSATYLEPVRQCVLQTVEPRASGKGWSALPIVPGASATVALAGSSVINGKVSVRQASYNAQQHGLQIVIVSPAQAAVKSSVQVKPGQFKNHTLQQIGNSLLQPFGLSFQFPNGVPPGADKPFPKVNLGFGETVFSFLESLSRMRNVYLRDDADGNIVATRATGNESPVGGLVEGKNIKSATAVLRDDYVLSKINIVGQKPGNDSAYGDAARDVSATANTDAGDNTYGSQMMEHPGDKQDAAMRADREMGENMATTVDVTVVVRGWLLTDGSLWIDHLGQAVSVKSPMLFPQKMDPLFIRAVTHRQADGAQQGTETELNLCLQNGLGAPLSQNYGGGSNVFPPTPQPAQPDGSDSE